MYYPDDAEWEGELPGSGRAFPHTMPEAKDKKYTTAMTTSPFGNDYTLSTAKTMIEAEQLGRGTSTDIVAINLSSNDYVGHMFGPQSLEVQDMTYRTDLQLGDFARFVEKHLGGDHWVLAISSDHGVGPIPEYAKTLKLPAGRDAIDFKAIEKKLEGRLQAHFGGSSSGKFIKEIDDNNVHLNADKDELKGDNFLEAQGIVRDALWEDPTIGAVFTREELVKQNATEGLALQFQRAFHPNRSGDVMFCQVPYHIIGKSTATHGSPWSYDSHVPLLLWGEGIRGGRYERPVTPASIAPTLARLLGVEMPPSCSVGALNEVLAP
jgi:hypothetical protein